MKKKLLKIVIIILSLEGCLISCKKDKDYECPCAVCKEYKAALIGNKWKLTGIDFASGIDTLRNDYSQSEIIY